ncbi:Aste57867_8710 [Aphanomyces stellatus]|uniref:Aste57867_8710 protein n=1 Tax=Aphanomyces stellatus TaxID=120398 RepID=A0A485KL20_9STRA|nr:hypothetical protein As57867_008676 [Aphanomyces stellatus]VFT85596.1 Aste57867_8710 [Aphanomyces stellatus]
MATVASSMVRARLGSFLATYEPPPAYGIPPLLPRQLVPSLGMRSLDTSPPSLVGQKIQTWRRRKLCAFVLSWTQLQQVRYLVVEAATLLPFEDQLVQWIAAQQAMVHGQLETDPGMHAPPCLDELDFMHELLTEPLLNYSQFACLRSQLPAAAQAYCTADVFSQLGPHDMHGRMNGLTWLAFVQETSHQIEAFALLSRAADGRGKGYITEDQLTRVVTSWLDRVPWKHPLDPDFVQYYVLIASRSIWLSLVPYNTGKLHLDKAIKSPLVHALLPLQCRDYHESNAYPTNPFAHEAIRSLHHQYLQLDTNKNGMLSPDEVLAFGRKKAFAGPDQQPTHHLTRQFVERVFDELVTYDGEMDYKTFLDFNLYMRDHTSKHALQFFWRALDVHQCGTLNAGAIEYFLQGIADHVLEATMQALDVGVLCSELFDMIQPKSGCTALTFEHVWASGHGHSFVRILTDHEAYLQYERRENK